MLQNEDNGHDGQTEAESSQLGHADKGSEQIAGAEDPSSGQEPSSDVHDHLGLDLLSYVI